MTTDAREELTQLICLHTPYTGPRAQRAADMILEAGWMPARTPAADRDALAEARASLRKEIGPPTDRDSKWQPMVSAGEVRLLLDALDAADPAGDVADAVWTAGFDEGRAHERRKIYCGCGLCCASTPPERRGEWHKQHCQPRPAREAGERR